MPRGEGTQPVHEAEPEGLVPDVEQEEGEGEKPSGCSDVTPVGLSLVRP